MDVRGLIGMNDQALHELLITNLQKKHPEFNKPAVKHIKPWAEFKSVIKNKRLDLETVPMERIWFWSDQHFGHKNIIGYCNRPFEDVNQMERELMANYYSTITENDVCIWVGDVSFMNDGFTNDLLDEMPGYKILVLGNHDIDHGVIRKLNFDEVHSILSVRNFIVSHHPWWNVPAERFHIHGHIHNNVTNNPQHINVSVEHTNYKPRNLVDIMNEIKNRNI